MSKHTVKIALALILTVAGLSGCGNSLRLRDYRLPDHPSDLIPTVPDSAIKLSPSLSIPLEKIVFWGAYAGTAYLILDPFAPNWEIEEAPLPDDHIHFNLKMKRYYAGGAGEARVVFNRRAKDLVQYGGFEGYQILEYNEGMESSVLGSQRVAQGVIRLTRSANAEPTPQGKAPPARITPAKEAKPPS